MLYHTSHLDVSSHCNFVRDLGHRSIIEVFHNSNELFQTTLTLQCTSQKLVVHQIESLSQVQKHHKDAVVCFPSVSHHPIEESDVLGTSLNLTKCLLKRIQLSPLLKPSRKDLRAESDKMGANYQHLQSVPSTSVSRLYDFALSTVVSAQLIANTKRLRLMLEHQPSSDSSLTDRQVRLRIAA